MTDRRSLLAGTAAWGVAAVGAGALAPMGAMAATPVHPDVQKAIAAGHDAAVKRLQEWIALPSIAAEDLNYPAGAEYMRKLALDAGFQHAEIVPSKGKPGVFATYDAGAKKTLGLYFMYDGKQFDPAEWESPPLEARLIDRPGLGKIMMGRGAVNQKGPEMAVLAGIQAMRAAGRELPVNLVLVAEGEEEIASPNFHEIVTRPQVMAALKRTSGVIIPFSSQNPTTGHVVVNLGAKGAMELEMTVSGEAWGRGPKGDIHSSEKARVDSPPWRLVAALSTLVSPDGNTVKIDGVQEMVRPLTDRQRQLIAETAARTNEASTKALLGVDRWIDDMTWEQSMERLAAVPTVNIQGLVSGYTGPGGKTVLPGKAAAKIELRLVPDMTFDDTAKKLRAHLDRRGFTDVEVKITGGYGPTQTAEDAGLTRAQLATYERMGAKASVYPRLAGSWPGVIFTGPPLNLPAGQFGMGHGSGAHAPNEYFLVESARPGLAGMDEASLAFVEFMHQVARLA
ncbi:MAG: M20/M25/M40 family metallo-hydrolase [Phenylobacterium sp.]|nr:M20/M25/M40 family metallo-hydrolase [Phenylobacterium sp.]